MLTTETKTNTTAANLIQAKRQPFFSKEGQGNFFSKSNENADSFFSPGTIQTKLTIGQPNDKYEVEADNMADKVVQRLSESSNQNASAGIASPGIQRKCSSCEEEEQLQKKEDDFAHNDVDLQRKPIFESNAEQPDADVQTKPLVSPTIQRKCSSCEQEEQLQKKEEEELPESEGLLQRKTSDVPSENSPNLESRLSSSKGGGSSLPSGIQSSMGSEFGADFSGVRVHTGTQAVQMSQDIGAQAFTHGSDIYFNQGKYDTNSSSGKHLLAHELTHTMQQGGSESVRRVPQIQKEESDSSNAPAGNQLLEDSEGNIFDGNELILPMIELPRLKDRNSDRFPANMEIRKGKRVNTDHNENWRRAAIGLARAIVEKKVNKIRGDNKYDYAEGDKDFFFLKLNKNKLRLMGTEEMLRDAVIFPFWDRDLKKTAFQVDHIVEDQLGGEDTWENYELLETKANRTSGRNIDTEIRGRMYNAFKSLRKKDEVVFDALAPPYLRKKKIGKREAQSFKNFPKKKVTFTERKFSQKKISGDHRFWGVQDYAKLSLLKSFNVMTAAQVKREGLSGSNPKHLVIFVNEKGGLPIKIPWGKNKPLNTPVTNVKSGNFMGGRINLLSVLFNPSDQGGTNLGYLEVEAFKTRGAKLLDKSKNPTYKWKLKKIPGLEYGGFIERKSVAENIRNSLLLPGLSPLEFQQVELDSTRGIVASGKVLTDIPFLKGANITVDIIGNDLYLSKTFTAGDIKFPSIFKINNSTLEVSIGSSKLKASGEIDFEIKNVGEGSVKVSIDSKGNIRLKGNFEIASEMFKSDIKFGFERTAEGENLYTIGGSISLIKDKVKGLKKAEAEVLYENGKLSAKGMAQPDIKGFDEIEMAVEIREDGYTFGGKIGLSDKVPMIKKGDLELTVNSDAEGGLQISGSGTVEPNIPGLNSGTSITIVYNQGAIMIQGEVPFEVGNPGAKGKVNVGITNQVVDENGKPTGEISERWTAFGDGKVTVVLGKGIAADVEVKLKPTVEGDYDIIVSGKVGLSESVSQDKPPARSKEFMHDLFKISPPSIILFAIPPIGASLTLGIEGGARLYAYFTPPYFKELSIGLEGFNLTHPDDDFEINGEVSIGMSAQAGINAYLTLKATLSVLVAAVEGRLTGSIGLEANAEALASLKAKWSKAKGFEIEEGMLGVYADARFVAKLTGGIRVYLDLWLAEIDIWEEELEIASVKFGDALKVGLELPISMKDGELQMGAVGKDSFKYPDINNAQKQQELVKNAATQDEKVKEPPPPSKEEAIWAVNKLDAGPYSGKQIHNMDGDEARTRVAFGWITRDTYILWLLNKHNTLNWGEVVAIGRRKDRSDFERFRADFQNSNLDDYFKKLLVSSFVENHFIFSNSNMAEIRQLLKGSTQNSSNEAITEPVSTNQSVTADQPPEPPEQNQSFPDQNMTSVQDKEENMSMAPVVQTKPTDDSIQRKEQTSNSFDNQLTSKKGKGKSLPENIQEEMGSVIGKDFSDVKIHDDSSSAEMNKELGAQAFTHDKDIYFNKGKYDTNSDAGKHLLAHELTHTVQQGSSIKNKVQARKEQGICSHMGKEVVPVVPNAANILISRYPHLAKVISGAQLQKIQNVIDARFKIDMLREKQKPFRNRLYFDRNDRVAGGSSADVRKSEYYDDKILKQRKIIARDRVFFIDSKLLTADDVRKPQIDGNSAISAFHEQLYKRFTETPIRIIIEPCLTHDPTIFDQFINYSWMTGGGVFWDFSNEKGLIRFKHLMNVQHWSLNYSQVVLGEQIKILDRMIELRREIGDTMIVSGKKLGVLYGLFWDTDIEIGREVGDIGGYYNDGRGRLRMYNDLTSKGLSKVSRVVLKNGDWLHIFSTSPAFSSTELPGMDQEGYLYLLTERYKSSDIEIYKHVITSDQRDLHYGKSWFLGGGWRMKRELSEFEEFAIGAIFGDAFEASSGSSIFGQIVTGLIPVVGQIADARDVAIGIHKMWSTGLKDGKLNTALAFVGLVPFLGDYIKNSAKVPKNSSEVAVKSANTKAVVDAVNEIGDGVANEAGKKLVDVSKKEGKEGLSKTLESLPGVKSGFVKSVIKHGDEAGGKLPHGVKSAAESTEGVSEAFGRSLPDLQNPKLVTQSSFKVGDELHLVKVVQIGNWKQLWLCSKCGSLIQKIDEVMIEATGKTRERLKELRKSAVSLEKSANLNEIKGNKLNKKVGEISNKLREVAKEGGLSELMHEILTKDYFKAYKVFSIDELSPGAKEALKRGYEVTPNGYHWRLNPSGELSVVKSGGLPKLLYDAPTHSFIKDIGAKTSKKFDEALTAKEAFKELGGLDPSTAFGKFVKVAEEELGVSQKHLIDLMDSQNSAGFKGLFQDRVRHILKKPYMDRLYTKITDVNELVKTDTFKKVMKETNNTNVALRAAGHERLIEVGKQISNSDKGSLGEKWFKDWFTTRGEQVSKQVVLGAEQGMKYKPTRKIDIYEDHIAREVKNVTSSVGEKGTEQLSDQLSGVLKDVKVDGFVTGYDSVRWVFLDPVGVKKNASWMIEQLAKYPDKNLSFQIMNKYGMPRAISAENLKNMGADNLKKYIMNWIAD